MTKIQLKAQARDITGKKVKQGRREGLIPAVVYGNKVKPKNVWVNYVDFNKVYKNAGESTLIELGAQGDAKASVLIHEVQNDPITGSFSHIDFFQVRMDQKLETEVPLEFIGESGAVKSLGGVLIKSIDAIPVSCLPADLPPKIDVDISKLATFNDSIKIGDLKISEKVTVQIEPETVVANVIPPRSEQELAQLEEKVEEDVTKVAGVVKETPEAEKIEEEKKE